MKYFLYLCTEKKCSAMRNTIIITLLLSLLLVGCIGRQPHYRVGVSQCLDDAWRQKMNDEIDCECLLHPEMSLTRRVAYGSSERQCVQIDSFISERVDLLIVSPNEAEEVKPAITRAYRAGIPIIIADRRVPGDEWTAFIGGDNYHVGLLMAEWVSSIQAAAAQPIQVLEVCGLPGSIPEHLRHKGFADGLASKRISGLADECVSGEPEVAQVWGFKDAYSTVSEYLQTHKHIDAIVAQNDLMAVESAKAVRDAGLSGVRIMGVDGIIVGLQAIVDGTIECSAIYPTRGDLIVQTAAQILAGEPFVRDTVLATQMIDANSAQLVLREYEARVHNLETIKIMQLQSSGYIQKMHSDRIAMIAVCVFVGLLFLLAIASLLYMQRKMQAEIKKDILPQLEEVQEAIQLSHRDIAFAERLKQIIDDHLTDPNLNVEFLADILQLDRTQVFRRVKAATGKAPLEYIRERRLLRANELLRTTDKTVKQVSRELCFSSPGFFSKYYKEQFGHLPSQQ